MAKSDRTNLLKFFGNLIARIRKWLIKIGSPFRISRRLVRDLQSASSRRRRQAGFVLPTVAMVSVLTTLLVVTIVSRSSERAQTAANARVEQTFRAVNAPIVDRARAKLAALFTDDSLPRTTPSNQVFNEVLASEKYTYPDEIRLQITDDFNNDKVVKVTGDFSDQEFISSAWKFPIDTDGNGKFDSFGLYSIVFRTRPETQSATRPTSILEARALPMDEGQLQEGCVGASANVATTEGWADQGDKLKKAFFVYATTVPIRPQNPGDSLSSILAVAKPAGDPASPAGQRAANPSNYEFFPNARVSFSAVELQQDRERIPFNTTAVWFENDLELARPATFRINGKIYTSANLMVGARDASNPIKFFRVSSTSSCYYNKEEYSKILVAGNVVKGDALTSDDGLQPATVDLLRPNSEVYEDEPLVESIKNDFGKDVASNEAEYNRRINLLVNAVNPDGVSVTFPGYGQKYKEDNITNSYPKSVKKAIANYINDEGLSTNAEFRKAARRAFEIYFRERVRKVPYKEVPFGTTPSTDPDPIIVPVDIDGSREFIPPVEWMIPYDNNPTATQDKDTYTANWDGKGLLQPPDPNRSLTLNINDGRLSPPATEPSEQKVVKEQLVGDRVLVGNNLPARWLKRKGSQLFFANRSSINEDNRSQITIDDTVKWDQPSVTARYRYTQADTLATLGESKRGGFWEISAALDPALPDPLPSSVTAVNLPDSNSDIYAPAVNPRVGGVRVVTNAGIFTRQNNPTVTTEDAPGTFLPRYRGVITDDPATPHAEDQFTDFVVWPDSMPMTAPVVWLDSKNFASVCNPASKCDGTITGADAGYYPIDGKTGIIRIGNNPTERAQRRAEANRKGDLQMRASAIYHYKYDAFSPDPRVRGDYQDPVACVSSYYDPSFSILENPFQAPSADNRLISTARNRSGLPWESAAWGRSNNGIVYIPKVIARTLGSVGSLAYSTTGPNAYKITGYDSGAANPADASISLVDRLAYQANLIYPNGRWVNEPLRNALIKVIQSPGKDFAKANLTIAEQSTIDANLCALQIMQNQNALQPATGEVNGAQIPHGTFKEAAFLDGREVKSLTRDEKLYRPDFATKLQNVVFENRADIYDLEIEQREPLEIRVTDIDIEKMRRSEVRGPRNNTKDDKLGVDTEYLLPYSGIVYASREDALPDLSDKTPEQLLPDGTTDRSERATLSTTDFILDPSRRPSAIRLINGYYLWRGTGTSQPNYTPATRGEKGLILVSNLPVYIKGQKVDDKSGFNVHTQEEFKTRLLSDWSNFYTRSDRNENFACRPGSFSGKCSVGDTWRPATVIADAVTIQSADFRDGYRNDGDYDLRNNADTSTSVDWQRADNAPSEKQKDSLYVTQRRHLGFFNNNFVTSANWLTAFNSDGGSGSNSNFFPQGNRNSYNANGVTPVQRRLDAMEYSMEICRKLPVSECTFADWVKDGAGTTSLPDSTTYSGTPNEQRKRPRYIHPQDSRYARRLAFLRYNDIYGDGNYALVMAGACPNGQYGEGVMPMPIGVFAVNNPNDYKDINTGNMGNPNAGNATNAFTYPQILFGNVGAPFNISRRNSYGDVPCPPPAVPTIRLFGTSEKADSFVADGQRTDLKEGRRRNQPAPDEGILNPVPIDLPAGGPVERPVPTILGPGGNLPLPSDSNICGGWSSTNYFAYSGTPGNQCRGNDTQNRYVYRKYVFRLKLENGTARRPGSTIKIAVRVRPDRPADYTSTSAIPSDERQTAMPADMNISTAAFNNNPDRNSPQAGDARLANNNTTPIASGKKCWQYAQYNETNSTGKDPRSVQPADNPTQTVPNTCADFLPVLYAENGTPLPPSDIPGYSPNWNFSAPVNSHERGGWQMVTWGPDDNAQYKNFYVLVVRDSAYEGNERFFVDAALGSVNTSQSLAVFQGHESRVGNIIEETPISGKFKCPNSDRVVELPDSVITDDAPALSNERPALERTKNITRSNTDVTVDFRNNTTQSITVTRAVFQWYPLLNGGTGNDPNGAVPVTNTIRHVQEFLSPIGTVRDSFTELQGRGGYAKLPIPTAPTLPYNYTVGTVESTKTFTVNANTDQKWLARFDGPTNRIFGGFYVRLEFRTADGTPCGYLEWGTAGNPGAGGPGAPGGPGGGFPVPTPTPTRTSTPTRTPTPTPTRTPTPTPTRTPTPTPTRTPTPTPTPTSRGGGGSTLNQPVIAQNGSNLPMGALLTQVPEVAAAYPFTENANSYPRCFGPDTIPTEGILSFYPNGKYYRYGNAEVSTNPILRNRKDFGDNPADPNNPDGSRFKPFLNSCITDRPPSFNEGRSLFGEGQLIPPPSATAPSTSKGGEIPMLPGMMWNPPNFSPRGLWYRSTSRWAWMGQSNDAEFGWNQWDRGFFLYNHSYPQIGGTTTANPHQRRLVLPETVCINIENGQVDAECTLDNPWNPDLVPDNAIPSNLAQLNAPRNPLYPNQADGSGNRNPASGYAVCGAVGSSRKYQSIQAFYGGSFRRDITGYNPPDWGNSDGTSCPQPVRTVIRDFYNKLALLDPAQTDFVGLHPKIIDTKSGETILDQLQGQLPSIPKQIKNSPDREGFNVILEARNTYSDNRVHVVKLCSIFAGDSPGDSPVPCPAVDGTTKRVLTGTLTLRANPNESAPSPVFILQSDPNEDLELKGLRMRLEGVDPNNVFWIINRVTPNIPNAPDSALTITSVPDLPDTPSYDPIPSILVGNFIGRMPASGTGSPTDTSTLNIGEDVSLRSTRFLGFRAVPRGQGIGGAIGVSNQAMVVAMTSVDEPMVVPVNQFHVPTYTGSLNTTLNDTQIRFQNRFDGDAINGNPSLNTGKNGQWTQRAVESEINVYFVAGNSPSRSYLEVPNLINDMTAESGGGLQNFVRFMENWAGVVEKSLGGFIQSTRSSYATAPFSATFPYSDLSLAELDYSSNIDTIFRNPRVTSDIKTKDKLRVYDSGDPKFGIAYNSLTSQALPFYHPPIRQWGFDVGLLTQTPDRFAERFSRELPTFNDFFREMEKSDPWVRALLCSAQPADPTGTNRTGTNPRSYTVRALYGLADLNEADCLNSRTAVNDFERYRPNHILTYEP
ncbi:MAG: hormogonium polysaccharide biosynthesis protein HpsA [Pseudanabaenaceae cyanobacterium]